MCLVQVLKVGSEFNWRAAASAARRGGVPAALAEPAEAPFWAQTRNGSRGYVVASYPVEVADETAELEAGVASDFLHDDISLALYDLATGRLVRAGAHRRSLSHLKTALPPGRCTPLPPLRPTHPPTCSLDETGGGEGVR